MDIEVKLVGLFQAGRFKQKTCNYPAGTNVQQIFDDLQLPEQHLGIVLINGLHATRETVLYDGDRLALLPLLEGG